MNDEEALSKDHRYLLAKKFLKSNSPEMASLLFRSLSPRYRLVEMSRIDLSKRFHNIPYVGHLREVTVEGGQWILVDGNLLYYKESSGINPAKSHFLQERVSRNGKFAVIYEKEDTKRIESLCVLLGGDNNYCHWLLRYLSRLLFIENNTMIGSLPFLINKELKNFQKESLLLLGIPENRLIKISSEETVRCKELIVPFSPRITPETLILACNWIRLKFGDLFCRDKEAAKRLYVSREDAERRHITNENEVWMLLQNLGFEKVIPGQLSFKEQIEIFSSAKAVVGAHGAGLTNLVFCPPKTTVIELSDIFNVRMDDFKIISKALEHHYYRLVSKDVIPYRRKIFLSSNINFQVDLANFRHLLNSCLPT